MNETMKKKKKKIINQNNKSYVALYIDLDQFCVACQSQLIIGLLFEVFPEEDGTETMELKKSLAGCKNCGLTCWVLRLEEDGDFKTINFYIHELFALYDHLYKLALKREQDMIQDEEYLVFLNYLKKGQQDMADEIYYQLARKYKLLSLWLALEDLEDILIFYLITPELEPLIPIC